MSQVLTCIPQLPRRFGARRAELEATADDFGKVLHLEGPRAAVRTAAHGPPRPSLPPARVRPCLRSVSVPASGPCPSLPPVRVRGAALGALPRLAGAAATRRRRAGRRRRVPRRARGGRAGVIVVGQTTPEQERIGLRTVRTIVPGLLPIDSGWSRQRAPLMPRLRTAARRAGLRSTAAVDGPAGRGYPDGAPPVSVMWGQEEAQRGL
ncbi:hypothetical protein [Streptomyces bathyalis]|uniref:hypothetical protein n=1 Tax=Streptomyces bathyalis TaxID=2710756 RepID=UPI001FEAC7E2|nr:hypothetical protein [Streptomyces bathyalis]